MRVTFLGTGTSTGVPVVGCDCPTCRSDDPRDRRFRPSVHLELADGTRVVVDTTPDFRSQALARGLTGVDVILFTHEHADHVMGLDDVRPFSFRHAGAWRASHRGPGGGPPFDFRPGPPIPCLGDERTLAALRRIYSYVWDPATPRGGGLPQLRLVEVTGRFSLGRSRAAPVPLLHGTRPILGYRVDDFAYLTDCSTIPAASWPLLEGLSVLVLGALRHRPHPTHLSLSEAVETAGRIGAGRTYFTHMSHDLPHAATCAALPPGVTLAHDGLVVDV